MERKDFPHNAIVVRTRILSGFLLSFIAEHGKDFRVVMPLASKETKGRADGKRVSELVREMTA